MAWAAHRVCANAWSDLHPSMLPVIHADRSLRWLQITLAADHSGCRSLWLQITLGRYFPVVIRGQAARCEQRLLHLKWLLLQSSHPEGSCPAGVSPGR